MDPEASVLHSAQPGYMCIVPAGPGQWLDRGPTMEIPETVTKNDFFLRSVI